MPSEPDTKIKILETGNFHNNEVWKGADNKQWYGLFQTTTGYYVKKTIVQVKTVYDALLDTKYVWSGRQVSVSDKDTCLLLITGISLPERNIDTVVMSQKTIWPSEKNSFTVDSITYTLRATGKRQKISNEVSDYRLYISIIKDGVEKQQLLVEHDVFDDTMTVVMWVGDLDGDYKPDAIIDVSNHYNNHRPALFLSGEASEKEIMKKVAEFSQLGC
ncbi:hypothetical protein QNI19_29730 [Cytophagaceae bacterium DM2B3-1]|uniref:Uncharacterized protein n=1 Tax=Xanthocytophaga flava TaxID=3048013 RepID=A0ABT7CU03_9BACT|nr:hypothetical protein [Xanthocytophaga flavus]MDJ1471820.1 hypothetical protein [Xanthocytophaga flavus]MDJ1497156.1 hypothetical protein [Xanthocytophaga flavus]